MPLRAERLYKKCGEDSEQTRGLWVRVADTPTDLEL